MMYLIKSKSEHAKLSCLDIGASDEWVVVWLSGLQDFDNPRDWIIKKPKYLEHDTCPSCNEPEAFVYDDLFSVMTCYLCDYMSDWITVTRRWKYERRKSDKDQGLQGT